MHPFYQKIKLSLDDSDRTFLNYLAEKYAKSTRPYQVGSTEYTWYQDAFLRNFDEDYRSAELFKKLKDLFVVDSQYRKDDWIYNQSQISVVPGSLPPHIDQRKCALSIAISEIKTPVYWYQKRDDSKHICSYDYSSPITLINTSILHGSPNNDSVRIFFQIGGFREDFSYVVSNLKQEALFYSI
jgi:hypothetical protein